MIRNGIMQQQRVKLLNQTDSLNMVKNVVRLGISIITYLRDLFDEQAYDDVVFQGMTLKMLKRVDTKSDMLLNWLDRGIFDAIEKQYLQMLIFDINDIKDNTIECYKFTFNYNREDGTGDIDFAVESTAKPACNTNPKEGDIRNEKSSIRMYEKEKNISNAQRLNDIKNRLLGGLRNPLKNNLFHTLLPKKSLIQSSAVPGGEKETIDKIKRHHRDETTKKAKRLLETLVSLTADLGPLPERTYLSMKLLYYDEYTPEEYQPELFREPQEQDLIAFHKKPDSLTVGDLGTDYHALSVSISTTCLPNRSWTIEELYEQLILTERKETIKKSLSLVKDMSTNDFTALRDKQLPKIEPQLTENEQITKHETHMEKNVLDFHTLITASNIQEQNTHITYTKQIFDNSENQSMHCIPSKSTLTFNSKLENKPCLKMNMEIENETKEETQKQKIHKKNKIEYKHTPNGKESQEAETSKNTGTEKYLIPLQDEKKQAANESDKKKNIFTSVEQENTQKDEEHIKKYILSNKVTSKQQLKKIYQQVSSATLSEILNELIKDGMLKQYKHSVYRLCTQVTGSIKNDKKNNVCNKRKQKKEDKKKKGKKEYSKKKEAKEVKGKKNESEKKNDRKKTKLQNTIKNNTKTTQSNNKNDAYNIFSQHCKQITSNDVSQSVLHMTQSNVLSSTLQSHKIDTQSTLLPLLSSNETKTQRLNIERSTFKTSTNCIHSHNKSGKSSYKKCQDGIKVTDIQSSTSNLITRKTDQNINIPNKSTEILNNNNNTITKKKKKKKKKKT